MTNDPRVFQPAPEEATEALCGSCRGKGLVKVPAKYGPCPDCPRRGEADVSYTLEVWRCPECGYARSVMPRDAHDGPPTCGFHSVHIGRVAGALCDDAIPMERVTLHGPSCPHTSPEVLDAVRHAELHFDSEADEYLHIAEMSRQHGTAEKIEGLARLARNRARTLRDAFPSAFTEGAVSYWLAQEEVDALPDGTPQEDE